VDESPDPLAQPPEMARDLFSAGALDLDADPHSWIPQSERVWFRPLILNASQGYYVNLLHVKKAGVLSRHRHLGPVHAFTLRGSWHYLEHEWNATAGSYVFEPAGVTHTLIVGSDPMMTLFHVTGGYVYVDDHGGAVGYEDVFTKIAAARAHYARLGLSSAALERIIR
jgi:2,4'-dihydroxyacetophenone dioxygenase